MHAGDPAEQLADRATALYIRAPWLLMAAAWIVRQVFAAQHELDSDGIGSSISPTSAYERIGTP